MEKEKPPVLDYYAERKGEPVYLRGATLPARAVAGVCAFIFAKLAYAMWSNQLWFKFGEEFRDFVGLVVMVAGCVFCGLVAFGFIGKHEGGRK